MEPITIRNLLIGKGSPKTIVSLMGKTIEDAITTGKKALEAGADCLEWRADYCINFRDITSMEHNATALRNAFPNTALLFTFRSTGQGGQADLSVSEYSTLMKAMIHTGAFDLVDIESLIGDDEIRALSSLAHECKVCVVVSHHDFETTPAKEWMVNKMRHMQSLGADIPKIAVMAHTAADTLTLLQATDEMSRLYADGPLITMAMGRWGALSRLTGEVFGSAMTFCSLETASAPGQVDIALTNALMESIHHIHCDA